MRGGCSASTRASCTSSWGSCRTSASTSPTSGAPPGGRLTNTRRRARGTLIHSDGWWPVAGQQQEVDDVDEVEGGAGKAVAQRAALLRAGRRRRRVRCSAHGAAARTSLRPAPPRRTRHRWRQINSAGPTPVAAPPGAGRRAAQGRLDNGENESGRLPVFHDLHRRHGDGGAARESREAEEARISFGARKRPKFSRLRRAGPPAAPAAGSQKSHFFVAWGGGGPDLRSAPRGSARRSRRARPQACERPRC